MTHEERFWLNTKPGPNGCILWGMSCTSNGYGRFCIGKSYVLAHRYAYRLRHGPIPDRHEIHHVCETRNCVNPDHMIAATHREHNVELTPHSPAAVNAAKTHCDRGHELTPENIYVWPRKPTQRHCKTCRRDALRRFNGYGGPRKHREDPYFGCARCGRSIRGQRNFNAHRAACQRGES